MRVITTCLLTSNLTVLQIPYPAPLELHDFDQGDDDRRCRVQAIIQRIGQIIPCTNEPSMNLYQRIIVIGTIYGITSATYLPGTPYRGTDLEGIWKGFGRMEAAPVW